MSADPDAEAKELASERLRERVYVTFTAIAVLLALNLHVEDLTVRSAILTLAITAVGTVLASSVAEAIAHVFVHEEPLSGAHVRRMAVVALGALSAVTLPVLLMVAVTWGWWGLHAALSASVYLLTVTLAVIVWSGVRRTPSSLPRKMFAVLSLSLLALVVIVLKGLAH